MKGAKFEGKIKMEQRTLALECPTAKGKILEISMVSRLYRGERMTYQHRGDYCRYCRGPVCR